MGKSNANPKKATRTNAEAANDFNAWKKATGLVIEAHEKRIADLEAELERVKGLLHY